MSQLWSEINKVVNVLNPAALTSGASAVQPTDVVDMENYKKCTFLLTFGAVADHVAAVTVNAYSANTTGGSAIAYNYRTQITGTGGASGTTGSDVVSSGANAETFNTTTGSAGATYIVEVDASTVAAEGTDYDHTYLVLTNSTGNITTRLASCVAVLSEPRYPQAILDSAIV